MTELGFAQDPATVGAASVVPGEPSPAARDEESARWLCGLRPGSTDRDEAIDRLHGLLLRAARREVVRRRASMPNVTWGELEIAAQESADDAVVAVLDRLASFEGRSRFTTWAYKFAVLNTSVTLRRLAWREREIPRDAGDWPLVIDLAPGPEEVAQGIDLASALRRAIYTQLTPHQREVIVALAVMGVPIDVLADRLGTSRGALYKTLHDARAALRRSLRDAGFLASAGKEDTP